MRLSDWISDVCSFDLNHLSNGRRHSLDRRHRPKRGSGSVETMTVQIIEVAGNRMAVLPEDEYRRLLDVVEDREDRDAASHAEERRKAGEEYIPASEIGRAHV